MPTKGKIPIKKTTALRNLLAKDGIIVAPGATTALFGYLVELAGFDMIFATGVGIANMNLGLPDLGLTTMSENLEVVKRINDATKLPILTDIDNGYGNATMVYRTVREYTACGVAGLHMEDQQLPKRCGHFDEKSLVSKEEMIGKIKAAKDAMVDPDTVLLARTDAIGVNGLEDAIERANAYREAGADLLFLEAPTSREMLAAIPAMVEGLHVVNMVEGGKTPPVRNAQLREMGFKLALYANAPLKAAVKGVKDLLAHIKTHDGTGDAGDLMIPITERNAIINFTFWQELENRFKTER